jgi:hypothetical protein
MNLEPRLQEQRETLIYLLRDVFEEARHQGLILAKMIKDIESLEADSPSLQCAQRSKLERKDQLIDILNEEIDWVVCVFGTVLRTPTNGKSRMNSPN